MMFSKILSKSKKVFQKLYTVDIYDNEELFSNFFVDLCIKSLSTQIKNKTILLKFMKENNYLSGKNIIFLVSLFIQDSSFHIKMMDQWYSINEDFCDFIDEGWEYIKHLNSLLEHMRNLFNVMKKSYDYQSIIKIDESVEDDESEVKLNDVRSNLMNLMNLTKQEIIRNFSDDELKDVILGEIENRFQLYCLYRIQMVDTWFNNDMSVCSFINKICRKYRLDKRQKMYGLLKKTFWEFNSDTHYISKLEALRKCVCKYSLNRNINLSRKQLKNNKYMFQECDVCCYSKHRTSFSRIKRKGCRCKNVYICKACENKLDSRCPYCRN